MAYISKEAVSEIRKELNNRFKGRFKFSVRRDGSSGVSVAIVSGKEDFSDLLKNNKRGYMFINHFYLGKYGKYAGLFKEILDIIKNAPGKAKNGRVWYDNSDSMIDYFDNAFYIDMSIGRFGKPYMKVE